jgi:SAM-dependent methyltransferase
LRWLEPYEAQTRAWLAMILTICAFVTLLHAPGLDQLQQRHVATQIRPNGCHRADKGLHLLLEHSPTNKFGSTNSKVQSREAFFDQLIVSATSIAAVIVPKSALGATFNPKTGNFLPDPGEIPNAIPKAWDGIKPPVAGESDFSRLDSSNDSLFYQNPRMVEHVDEKAVQAMQRYIAQVLRQQQSIGKSVGDRALDVLDLCASWTSHLPPAGDVRLNRVAGLGMNLDELKTNPSLTERIVQDLNKNPLLPYESGSFDVVFLQLSIDYLIKPLVVCQEVGRVLRPGGAVYIIFSNRVFLSKAVAWWTAADDVDRAFTVGSYLYFCAPHLFSDIRAVDLSNHDKGGRVVGDPLYVVTASKTPQISTVLR